MAVECAHCGDTGSLSQIGTVIVRESTEEHHEYGDIEIKDIVSVHVCSACNDVEIIRFDWFDIDGEPYNPRHLYPTLRNNEPLPPRVRKRWDKARKIKKVDAGSYAVAIRRVLETVCNEESAQGKDLFTKLNDLAEKGRIPDRLAAMGHQVRELGKFGSHDLDIEVSPADVPVIEDFAEAILEYLYRAPAKLEAARAGLARRKKHASD